MPAELPGTSFISTLNSPKRYFSVELNPAPEFSSRISDATCLPEASKSERTSPSVRNSSSQADCAEAGWKQNASATTAAARASDGGGASGARDRRAMAAVACRWLLARLSLLGFWKGAWSVGLGMVGCCEVASRRWRGFVVSVSVTGHGLWWCWRRARRTSCMRFDERGAFHLYCRHVHGTGSTAANSITDAVTCSVARGATSMGLIGLLLSIAWFVFVSQALAG